MLTSTTILKSLLLLLTTATVVAAAAESGYATGWTRCEGPHGTGTCENFPSTPEHFRNCVPVITADGKGTQRLSIQMYPGATCGFGLTADCKCEREGTCEVKKGPLMIEDLSKVVLGGEVGKVRSIWCGKKI